MTDLLDEPEQSPTGPTPPMFVIGWKGPMAKKPGRPAVEETHTIDHSGRAHVGELLSDLAGWVVSALVRRGR